VYLNYPTELLPCLRNCIADATSSKSHTELHIAASEFIPVLCGIRVVDIVQLYVRVVYQ